MNNAAAVIVLDQFGPAATGTGRKRERCGTMRFSRRTEWDTEESDLARAQRQRQQAGLPIADLTASNPTRCGFNYPQNLLDALADTAAFDYDPNPLGSLRAREAVSRYYRDRGAEVAANQIVLTTSTSEAYGYLFKLLCDSGDEILTPQPSYPLFDFLARAEGVELTHAALLYDHGWQLDLEGTERAITPKTRAIVLVHPNNPTGHFTKLHEAQALAKLCREREIALIIDEVFLDYRFDNTRDAHDTDSFVGRNLDVPVFVVSGISKICGLPQMKAAWLVALGPGSDEAMQRLEVIADTYLSMNAPIQCALPSWLETRSEMQQQIRDRVRSNLAALDSQLAAQHNSVVSRLAVEGGWYVVLRIPAIQPDELTARELLDLGVLIHPGYFFGMSDSGWLVVSLLGRTEEYSRGISILFEYLHHRETAIGHKGRS